MGRVCNYFSDHNLVINPNKSKIILFCAENWTASFQIRINSFPLAYVDVARVLGVSLDVKLRFSDHVTRLSRLSYLRMRTLYAHRYLMNYKLRKQLCESLVMSVLNYCDIVYFPCLGNRIKNNRLQIIQNNCIRFTYSLRKFNHVSDKYVSLKWLKLPKLVNYHFLIYVHKLLIESIYLT
nr:unnamed protein product [Callosobruchus chinensis]